MTLLPTYSPGDRLRFDGKATSWLVRAQTADGRYSLATASFFGAVRHTIIDWPGGVRGAMNISGHGLSIFTTSGADGAIDEAMAMLEEGIADEAQAAADGVPISGQWGISHRNQVRLHVTGHRPEGGAWRAVDGSG